MSWRYSTVYIGPPLGNNCACRCPSAQCCWATSRYSFNSLQWRHNGNDSISNHQPHDCLLNRLFRRRSKKTSKLRVSGLCAGNSPGPVSIWWLHHATKLDTVSSKFLHDFIDWLPFCQNCILKVIYNECKMTQQLREMTYQKSHFIQSLIP